LLTRSENSSASETSIFGKRNLKVELLWD